MNIEESVEYLKNCLNDEYNFKNATRKKDKEAIETLLTAYEKEKEKNKEYNMGIKNLISQIESAIDFMKTDKSKVKVDMYQQKEEDLKLEIVHLKKILKEE